MDKLTRIWHEVSCWPPEQRLAFATRLLQALQQEEEPQVVAKERQKALNQLIGIWKTDQPPDDQQVKRIVNQERMRKHG